MEVLRLEVQGEQVGEQKRERACNVLGRIRPSDPSACRAERAVAPSRLSSPSRDLLVECSDWPMSICDGGRAAVISRMHDDGAKTGERCLRDVVVIGSYLRQSLRFDPLGAQAAVTGRAWPPPSVTIVPRGPASESRRTDRRPGWALRPRKDHFMDSRDGRLPISVSSPDQAMISLFGAVALT